MKRTITSVAAATMALGMLVPVAFASSTTTGLSKASQLPIVVNGSVLSNPFEMTGKDSGNTTGFFPIYYFNQALSKIGFTATWDGVNHVWAITAPGVTPTAVAGGVGTGNTSVTVNGTVVKKFNTQAAKDPAGSTVTTYLPIFYINNVLSALGVKGTFSGQTGLSISQAQTQNANGDQLSALTFTGESSGTGGVSDPAVSLNSGSVKTSTTLTDANGNPVAGTQITFEVSEYGNKPSVLPTVSDANGSVLSSTSHSNYVSYTAYTDSNGTASISIQGPAGQTYAYEVVATAPYSTNSGSAIASKPAYVQFVANNQAGIAPFASQSPAYSAAMGTAVPITVALPNNSSGTAQANVLVTLTVKPVTGTTTAAYFTNAAGADLGQTIEVPTNASGLAQTFLNDSNSEEVQVSATLPSSLGVNDPQATYISFAQGGVASKINGFTVSSSSVQAGQNVTVSGQLQDATGNAVANGQILVVGNDMPDATTGTNYGSSNSGDFGYVGSDGKTVTDFPNVGLPTTSTGGQITVASGTAATSSIGDLVTADANGNFNFQVTDTNDDQYATFSIYSVSNGSVQTLLNSSTVDFTTGQQLQNIALGGTDSQASGNTWTSLTGLSAAALSNSTVFVDPQNAAGDPLTGVSFNYSLNVDNGGAVTGITSADGTSVIPINANGSSTPGLAAVTVNVAYNGSTYTISVPGQSGQLTGLASPDFGVDVYNENTGATNLTITNGAVKSTAAFNFTGSAPTAAKTFSPVSSNLVAGQSEKVTYTVEDGNGNPVANTEVPLFSTDTSNPLWITQVNSAALDQSENTGLSNSASEPTPIPLGTASYTAATPGYIGASKGVNINGVVAWDGVSGDAINLYTDANGQINFTVQNSGVSYWVTGTQVSTSNSTSATSEGFWTYASKHIAQGNSDVATYGVLEIGQKAGAPTGGVNSLFTTNLGTVTLGTGSSGQVSGSGNVSFSGGTGTNNSNYSLTSAGGTVTITGQTSGISGGSYSVVAPNGTVNPSGVVLGTNASGQETVTFSSGVAVGSYTIKYTLNGAQEATGTVMVNVGAASQTKSSVNLSQTSVTAGTSISVYGSVEDASGNAISGDNLTISGAGGSATVTTTSTGSYGASITPTTAGSETITVSDANGTIGTAALTVNVAAPASATLNYANATMTTASAASADVSNAPTLVVKDQYGNVISGAAAAGTFSIDSSSTNAGVVGTDYSLDSSTGAFKLLTGTTATGTYIVDYTNTASNTVTAQFTITVS